MSMSKVFEGHQIFRIKIFYFQHIKLDHGALTTIVYLTPQQRNC
jgi:hypothetical protein